MNNKPMTMKPGLLVALHTRIEGGISYARRDLDASDAAPETAVDPDAPIATVARWETTRVITDADEHERATKVRGKASSLIRSVCTQSAFGLLCSTSRESELDAAFVEAQALVEKFNESAEHTRVSVYLLKGRIAENDEVAAQAIGAEVREMLDAMKAGLEKADPEAIRKAAAEARQFGQMLDAPTAEKVSKAIEEARSAARAIVRRVEKGGEDAALVIQELSRKAIDEARFAFLDLGARGRVEDRTAAPSAELDLDASESEVKSSALEARAVEV